jgi:hypothetical protein
LAGAAGASTAPAASCFSVSADSWQASTFASSAGALCAGSSNSCSHFGHTVKRITLKYGIREVFEKTKNQKTLTHFYLFFFFLAMLILIIESFRVLIRFKKQFYVTKFYSN